MADLTTKIAGTVFNNPLIAASGTFGFGREYAELYPLSRLGGISCKGTTPEIKDGNPPPRIAETPSGMLNSVGLQNPGIDSFIKNELPWLKNQGTVIIANIAAPDIDGCADIAGKLNDTAVDMIELNISCPNVKKGGASFGVSAKSAGEVTRAVRKACKKPLMVKLTPNVTDITEIAAAVESEGADAVSLINTLTGMRINIKTRRPVLFNNTGGLSGPAVLPVAIRMVWQVANRVKIPVVGLGGISKWEDAVEMLMAGASAFQVGTAIISDPFSPLKIIDGLNDYMDKNGIKSVSDICGTVEPY